MKYIIILTLVFLLVLFQNCTRISKIDKILSLENENDIVIKINQTIWEKTGNDFNFGKLNKFEKNVIYIDLLEAQVNNGGFDQYFFNSSGKYAHEALIALEEINAPKMASLLREAISIFPNSPIPKDTGDRRELMDGLPDSILNKWDKLDEQFYKYPDDLTMLVIKYVKENKKHFQ